MIRCRQFTRRQKWTLLRSVCATLAGAWFALIARAGEVEEAPGPSGLRVGAAAIRLEADDSMVIAGGITPGKAMGEEGHLRAVAVVLAKQP